MRIPRDEWREMVQAKRPDVCQVYPYRRDDVLGNQRLCHLVVLPLH